MIRWTKNTEAVQLPAEPADILRAQAEAVQIVADTKDLRAYARRVSDQVSRAEQELQQRLDAAMAKVRSRMNARLGLVGFDLEAGETVLADPETRIELLRRPMNESERLIARQMPEPEA